MMPQRGLDVRRQENDNHDALIAQRQRAVVHGAIERRLDFQVVHRVRSVDVTGADRRCRPDAFRHGQPLDVALQIPLQGGELRPPPARAEKNDLHEGLVQHRAAVELQSPAGLTVEKDLDLAAVIVEGGGQSRFVGEDPRVTGLLLRRSESECHQGGGGE